VRGPDIEGDRVPKFIFVDVFVRSVVILITASFCMYVMCSRAPVIFSFHRNPATTAHSRSMAPPDVSASVDLTADDPPFNPAGRPTLLGQKKIPVKRYTWQIDTAVKLSRSRKKVKELDLEEEDTTQDF